MTKRYDIIWLDKTDSINEEAKRNISGLDNLSVLSALEQTDGKGQRGNTWSAKAGENLTFSIVLKDFPSIRAIDQFVISEIAALSVTDFLHKHGIEARIKWPNDIYVGDKKICGILIENSLRGLLLSTSIIGIGLNINQKNFDVNLPNPTSMALCSAESTELDIRICLEEFMGIFSGYCSRYLNITGGFTRLRKLYLSQMWRFGQASRFIDNTDGSEFNGTIRGLSEIGHLVVEKTNEGELKEFAFKEISYII